MKRKKKRMIIIDMNQVMISNLMGVLKYETLDESWVRKMILECLHNYEIKYSSEYGEMILAYDSKHYWRKDFFPHYKFTRKQDRKSSGLDWTSIFDLLNKIKDEIKTNFNKFKVIEVYGAEADDVISVLCRYKKPKEKVLIMSADKDFIQLQKYPGVYQYNPSAKQYIVSDSPYYFIKEHIIRGDKSDGIPNILSDDDTFTTQKKQRPITQKNLDRWIDQDPSSFCRTEQQVKNYNRNKILIDLDCIPLKLEDDILSVYRNINKEGNSIPYEYLENHKLFDLIKKFYNRHSKK